LKKRNFRGYRIIPYSNGIDVTEMSDFIKPIKMSLKSMHFTVCKYYYDKIQVKIKKLRIYLRKAKTQNGISYVTQYHLYKLKLCTHKATIHVFYETAIQNHNIQLYRMIAVVQKEKWRKDIWRQSRVNS
jgi:hypothetical protein